MARLGEPRGKFLVLRRQEPDSATKNLIFATLPTLREAAQEIKRQVDLGLGWQVSDFAILETQGLGPEVRGSV